MQEYRAVITLLLKIYFGPKSTSQARGCMNIELYQFAPINWFWAKFHITSQGMKEHRAFISSFQKFMKAKFSHNKSRNVGTSNIYQFAPKNLFLAKFHITSQGMQEHRTFISLILNINFEPNSIFQAKKCRNIKPLSVRF